MARIIATVSTKGGVGKTFCCANLGAALADLGQRVLLIDTDVQQSLSKYFELARRAPYGLVEMVTRASAVDCISSTNIENLDIVVQNDKKWDTRQWLSQSPFSRMYYLSSALKELDDLYDVIIMDTLGTRDLNSMQEIVIRSADTLITPLSADWNDAQELPNTLDLIKQIDIPVGGPILMNPLPPITILMWGIDRTTDNQLVLKEIMDKNGALFLQYHKESKGRLNILSTVIPQTAVYNKAKGTKTSVHRLEPKRPGPTPSGAESMLSLIHELFSHLKPYTEFPKAK